MFGGGLVWSPLQIRQAFSFRPFSRHQHYRRAAVLVLLQQATRQVLHLQQRSKISTLLSPTHELRLAKPRDLFGIAYNLLTNVVRKQSLPRPRNTSWPLGVWFVGLLPQ